MRPITCISWLLSVSLAVAYLSPSVRAQAASTITHGDIRDAMLTLVGATREQTSKLERHELRGRQVADVVTRMLNSMDNRSKSQEKNLDNLAILMARMDDRLRKMEESVIQRDERERIQLQKLMDLAVSIKSAVSDGGAKPRSSPSSSSSSNPSDAEVLKLMTRIRKKTETMEEAIQSRLSVMANEVKIVGDKFESRGERIEQLQMAMMNNLGTAQAGDAEKLRAASANLVSTETKWRQFLSDAQGVLKQFGQGVNRINDQANKARNDTSAILVGIEHLETALETTQKAIDSSASKTPALAAITTALGHMEANITAQLDRMETNVTSTLDRMEAAIGTDLKTSLTDIAGHLEVNRNATDKLAVDVQQNFELAEGWLEASVANITDVVESRVGAFEAKMEDSQKLIQDQVEESGQMAETLADRVDKSYAVLAKEIHGLHKVEQVLLDTADSVLDTKRRLEFAVQQILLELGESIKRQTGDLNTTLSQNINDVTFSVIANQTQSLTNMTTKLEGELGQVWRQIGVLYQSASQSQELLQRVEQQTAQHVGGSLQALSSMDKRVGQVTERVNEVDDHLNYLLGRLSLVVQEFNQVRGGLGEALESLRSGLAVTQGQSGAQKSPPYSVDSGTAGDANDDVAVITRKESLDGSSAEETQQ